MRFKKLLVVMVAVCVQMANAHEGHDTPGALPTPPNGGKIAEASHASAHAAGEKEEAELFLEGKLEGTMLKIFPHALDATDQSAFKTLKPGAKLTMVDLKLELPRAKKTSVLNVNAKQDYWESDIGKVTEKRILIYATVLDGSEKKTAKIQIER